MADQLPRAPETNRTLVAPSGKVWNELLREMKRCCGKGGRRNAKEPDDGISWVWVSNQEGDNWDIGTPIGIWTTTRAMPDQAASPQDESELGYAQFKNVFNGLSLDLTISDTYYDLVGLTIATIKPGQIGKVCIAGPAFCTALLKDPSIHPDENQQAFVSWRENASNNKTAMHAVRYPTPFKIMDWGSAVSPTPGGDLVYCKVMVNTPVNQRMYWGEVVGGTGLTHSYSVKVYGNSARLRQDETRDIKLSPALQLKGVTANVGDYVTIWVNTEGDETGLSDDVTDIESEYIIDVAAAGDEFRRVTCQEDINPGETKTCDIAGGAGGQIDVIFDWIDDEKISAGKEIIVGRFRYEESGTEIWRPVSAQCEDPPPVQTGN